MNKRSHQIEPLPPNNMLVHHVLSRFTRQSASRCQARIFLSCTLSVDETDRIIKGEISVALNFSYVILASLRIVPAREIP
jgi:hypothetical protein